MDNLNDNIEKFRQDAKLCIDYVCEYGKTVDKKSVVPNIKPGYLVPLMPNEAPQEPEEVKEILNDFEKLIMPGTLHWMHPKFYAYFPGGNAYPNILADILCTAIGGNGFTWTSQPSCTELENIMMDWYARALDLPNHFIFEESNGKGGGCIQNTASDAIFSTIVAARNVPLQFAGCYDRQGRASSSSIDVSALHPAIIVSKLVCYTSSESHSCVQKAAKLALCTIRVMTPNERNQITGEILEQYILKDKANDLIPFYCCATMGTTGAATFDHLASIGPCCKKYKLWLHVDGAYGGNTFLLPEMRYLKEGMEYADSFTINPYKLMLGAVDLNCMWVRDTAAYKKCFIINATYLIDQNEEGDNKYEIDYRHYGIPLSRRMRSLKLWFLFRCYGISGLQNYIRNIINCAKVFEKLVNDDPRFEVCNDVLTGLVCFRQKDLTGDGSTASQTDEHSLKLVDKLNINLLLRINDSRKLHLCPCTLQDKFVLRFSVNNEFASPKDIEESWKIIQSFYVSEIDEDLKLHFAKTASDSNRAASRLAFTTLLDSQEYMDYKKDLQNQIRLTFSKIVIRNDADVSSILKLPKYNETDHPTIDDKNE